MTQFPQRRPTRLARKAYECSAVFSITIGTQPRQDVFADRPFGRECIRWLRQLRDDRETPIYAYCLMPDHVHLLLASSERSTLPSFVQAWKSLCYRERRLRGDPSKFWQRSFYDHSLRKDEDLRRAARYILENPVRAGLADDFRDYPLCGSFEFDL